MEKKTIGKRILKVLCLEDSQHDAEIMREILIDAAFDLNMDIVSTEREFVSFLHNQKYDIILADYKLPGFEAPAALKWLNKISPDTPFICVSGAVGEDIAVELLKKGAVDYVLKDRMARLAFAVQRALDEAMEAKLRLQAEIDLQKSELRFHTLAEMSKVGIFQTDIEGSALYVNPQWCRMSGMIKEDALGQGWLQVVHSDDREKLIDGWNKATQEHDSSIAEYRFVHKDGSIVWVMGQAVPERNSKNQVIGYIGTVTDITERKRTEQALLESEERYRTLVKFSPDPLYVHVNGQIAFVNPALCQLIGAKHPSELIGKPVLEIIHPQYHKQVHERWDLVFKGTAVPLLVEKFIRLDGKLVDVEVNAVAIDWKGAKGVQVIARDITERILTEEALMESRSHYHSFIEQLPNAVFRKDKEGCYVLVNSQFCTLKGLNKEDFIGKKPMEIARIELEIQGEEGQATKYANVGEDVHELIMRTGQSIETDEEYPEINGDKLYMHVVRMPVFDLNGSVIGSQGIMFDITVRKRAEEALRKLSSAVEQSPSSIVITDLDGRIEYVNPKSIEISGYNREELIGQNPRIFSSGEKPKSQYKILWDTITSGKEWRGEFHNRKKSGELYWDSASISPIINEKGEITHYLAIKEDITEKKKILNELIEAKEKAEELNRAKSNFMANMSHELRTPLVGILGISELMMTETDGESNENANNIHESGLRLLKTITEILNFSKIESEKTTVEFSVINLTKLLLDEIKSYKKSADHKGILIIESFSMEVVPIITDEKLLIAIINNLINNAVKFTFTGKVTISFEQTNGDILIKISDTGIGIPKEKFELIFEEFRQLSEGIGRSFEGSGLGLTVVKKYVELLNGSISVESELNIGSTFIVRLPFIKYEEKTFTIDTFKPVKNESIPLPEKQIYKILIVDDDDINILTIRKMLEKDYYVIPVSNGADAVEEVKKQRVDIILMDINLKHGISGVETTQLIRTIKGYENIPIVAMTAYAMPDDRMEFLQSGCSNYLAKPFSKEDIIKLLSDIIKQKI